MGDELVHVGVLGVEIAAGERVVTTACQLYLQTGWTHLSNSQSSGARVGGERRGGRRANRVKT